MVDSPVCQSPLFIEIVSNENLGESFPLNPNSEHEACVDSGVDNCFAYWLYPVRPGLRICVLLY